MYKMWTQPFVLSWEFEHKCLPTYERKVEVLDKMCPKVTSASDSLTLTIFTRGREETEDQQTMKTKTQQEEQKTMYRTISET